MINCIEKHPLSSWVSHKIQNTTIRSRINVQKNIREVHAIGQDGVIIHAHAYSIDVPLEEIMLDIMPIYWKN